MRRCSGGGHGDSDGRGGTAADDAVVIVLVAGSDGMTGRGGDSNDDKDILLEEKVGKLVCVTVRKGGG